MLSKMSHWRCLIFTFSARITSYTTLLWSVRYPFKFTWYPLSSQGYLPTPCTALLCSAICPFKDNWYPHCHQGYLTLHWTALLCLARYIHLKSDIHIVRKDNFMYCSSVNCYTFAFCNWIWVKFYCMCHNLVFHHITIKKCHVITKPARTCMYPNKVFLHIWKCHLIRTSWGWAVQSSVQA